MSELSVVAGNSAPTKYAIEHEGRKYTFKKVDGVVLAEWETLRYNAALASLDSLQGRLSESAFERRCIEISERKDRGEYTFEAKESQAFLKTHPGIIFFLHLITGCDTPALIALRNSKGPQVDALIGTILRESFGIKDKGKKAKKDAATSGEAKEHEAPLG